MPTEFGRSHVGIHRVLDIPQDSSAEICWKNAALHFPKNDSDGSGGRVAADEWLWWEELMGRAQNMAGSCTYASAQTKDSAFAASDVMIPDSRRKLTHSSPSPSFPSCCPPFRVGIPYPKPTLKPSLKVHLGTPPFLQPLRPHLLKFTNCALRIFHTMYFHP